MDGSEDYAAASFVVRHFNWGWHHLGLHYGLVHQHLTEGLDASKLGLGAG